MRQHNRTYCEIIDYIEKLSMRINDMYDICPKIFLRFSQNGGVNGATTTMYHVTDMYIELNIPHNYTFGKKHRTMLACLLIHEYCHYIDALTMSGLVRANDSVKYLNDQVHRRAVERRNWTATKRLAKELELWNKSFYNIIRGCCYTTTLQF